MADSLASLVLLENIYDARVTAENHPLSCSVDVPLSRRAFLCTSYADIPLKVMQAIFLCISIKNLKLTASLDCSQLSNQNTRAVPCEALNFPGLMLVRT